MFIVGLKRIRHYSWITILGTIACLNIVYNLIQGREEPNPVLLITFVFTILCVLFGILMPRFLTPTYEIINETVKTENGDIITEEKFYFK